MFGCYYDYCNNSTNIHLNLQKNITIFDSFTLNVWLYYFINFSIPGPTHIWEINGSAVLKLSGSERVY